MWATLAAALGSMAFLAADQTAQPPAQPPVTITNPDWLRRPSAEALARFWPADSRGMSGRAVITCAVTARGTLDNCRLVFENPPGHGFGGAALLTAPMFVMRPMTRNGVAVGGAQVTIPINFQGGGVGANSVAIKVARSLPWGETPTAAAMAASFPGPSIGRLPYGHVVLRCQVTGKGTLHNCATASEDPPGHGFAGAARGLVKDFRVVDNPGAVSGAENLWVDVPFDFRDPGRSQSPVEIVDPQWLRTPDPTMAGKLFPEEAAKAGFKTGVATLSCEVAHGGALTNCQVASESPEELGFGKAALAIAGVLVMNPWTPQGAPVDGARVRVPIRVNLAGEPPQPSSTGR